MKLKVLFYYYNIVNFTHTLNVLFITKLAFLCQFFNFEKCGRPGGGVWPRGRLRTRGEGSRMAKILRTSFMDGPL